MTRLTDAELAEWDRRLKVGDYAENDVPSLLAELKAERERCAELRRLLDQHCWLDDLRCTVCGYEIHRDDCAIAKALKETEWSTSILSTGWTTYLRDLAEALRKDGQTLTAGDITRAANVIDNLRTQVAELEKEVAFLKEKKLALKNEVSELITKGRK